MKTLVIGLVLAASILSPKTIINFTKKSNLDNWRIIDDGVMGGKSKGNFILNKEGHGEFFGSISLKNYGGFSSLRYQPSPISTKGFLSISLKVKGDGKNYQFRIKKDKKEAFSYIQSFSTSGEWETIHLKLSEFYPSFRGRKLDMPNYSDSTLQECTFLIANKKEEEFRLEIDAIKLIK
jgi:hypothetical protein